MMRIEKNTYKVSEKNHYKTVNGKTQIVIGISLRKKNYHIVRLQNREYGNTKKWNTFTISREGKVYQHYDEKYHTDFLGIKEGDKCSISIVLENMGCLFQTESGEYINWLNEICDEDDVVEHEWMEYDIWEKIPKIQLKKLISLLDMLCEKHDIPAKIIEFNHYHKQIHKFKGIVFRSNYIEDSTDITPLLNIPELEEMLNNYR